MSATTIFDYKVRDQQGKMIEGTLEAPNQELVAAKLREMGYSPLSINARRKSLTDREFSFGKEKVGVRDLAVLSRQLATMIGAGMPLIRALNILTEQTENKRLAGAVSEICEDIEKGMSFNQAVERRDDGIFPPLFQPMIKAGESGGMLDTVLVRLARTLEKQAELRGKIRSAMAYPVMVGVMVVLIAGGMLVFIVPKFETMYRNLKGTLPLPTQILLKVSNAVTGSWWMVLLGIAGIVFGFKKWVSTPKGLLLYDGFKLKAPVFGTLVSKAAIARFARTLASLMRAGVPVIESLTIVSDTSGNAVMQKGINEAREKVRQGINISIALAEHPVFPPMVVQMMAVGEETGALDEMLEKMADFYEEEVEATVDALTSLIEPLLMAFMGVVVGGMIVALYMPIFKLITIVK
jgi:type IV pilus assembly protein PilC